MLVIPKLHSIFGVSSERPLRKALVALHRPEPRPALVSSLDGAVPFL